MKTIKEITEMLRQTDEPASWMEELVKDTRAGVKTALARWQRQYDKKKKDRTRACCEKSV